MASKKTAVADPSLRLKVGKFYRTRAGEKVGPVSLCAETSLFKLSAGGMTFLSGGQWSPGGNRPEDIVAEWVDNPAPEVVIPPPEPDQRRSDTSVLRADIAARCLAALIANDVTTSDEVMTDARIAVAAAEAAVKLADALITELGR